MSSTATLIGLSILTGPVSLGKSRSAALERLYQQAEVLVNEISEDGGAGAFINLRDDVLL